MPAKTMAAHLPSLTEAPPLAQYLRNAVRSLLKKINPAVSSAERSLVLEDRVTIGPKKSLVVVRCHGQRFLVATAGDTIGPVIEVAPPAAVRRTRREREV